MSVDEVSGWDVCLRLLEAGLLSRVEQDHIIRILPPLIITEDQLREGLNILLNVLDEFAEKRRQVD